MRVGHARSPRTHPAGSFRHGGPATWTPLRQQGMSPATGTTGSCACCWACGMGCAPATCTCLGHAATPTRGSFLLTPERWAPLREEFCRLVGKPAAAADALAAADEELDAALADLDALLGEARASWPMPAKEPWDGATTRTCTSTAPTPSTSTGSWQSSTPATPGPTNKRNWQRSILLAYSSDPVEGRAAGCKLAALRGSSAPRCGGTRSASCRTSVVLPGRAAVPAESGSSARASSLRRWRSQGPHQAPLPAGPRAWWCAPGHRPPAGDRAPGRRHTVRSASVGARRAARTAGYSPAIAPRASAAPTPPAAPDSGTTTCQCWRVA